MKTMVFMTLVLVILLSSLPAFAQRVVEPGELKISPNRYKNANIKLEDRFVSNRSGIPASLTAAGYTLNKYITFGVSGAGMRCFVRRNAAMEKLIGELKKGEQITVIGTVKQPKAKRKTAGRRSTKSVKLDIYIIEASKIIKGWEQ